jgi:DNA-binding MarR family transcriptional regulator
VGGVDESAVPLARLFAMAFRDLIDGLHERLVQRGWRDVRGSYGYVLLAVRDEPRTPTEIGSLMGMTKQAASKLVDAMEASGYVRGHVDVHDARAKRVSGTARGRRLLAAVEAIYAELEAEWATVLGAGRLEQFRGDLERVIRAGHDGGLPPVRPAR